MDRIDPSLRTWVKEIQTDSGSESGSPNLLRAEIYRGQLKVWQKVNDLGQRQYESDSGPGFEYKDPLFELIHGKQYESQLSKLQTDAKSFSENQLSKAELSDWIQVEDQFAPDVIEQIMQMFNLDKALASAAINVPIRQEDWSKKIEQSNVLLNGRKMLWTEEEADWLRLNKSSIISSSDIDLLTPFCPAPDENHLEKSIIDVHRRTAIQRKSKTFRFLNLGGIYDGIDKFGRPDDPFVELLIETVWENFNQESEMNDQNENGFSIEAACWGCEWNYQDKQLSENQPPSRLGQLLQYIDSKKLKETDNVNYDKFWNLNLGLTLQDVINGKTTIQDQLLKSFPKYFQEIGKNSQVYNLELDLLRLESFPESCDMLEQLLQGFKIYTDGDADSSNNSSTKIRIRPKLVAMYTTSQIPPPIQYRPIVDTNSSINSDSLQYQPCSLSSVVRILAPYGLRLIKLTGPYVLFGDIQTRMGILDSLLKSETEIQNYGSDSESDNSIISALSGADVLQCYRRVQVYGPDETSSLVPIEYVRDWTFTVDIKEMYRKVVGNFTKVFENKNNLVLGGDSIPNFMMSF